MLTAPQLAFRPEAPCRGFSLWGGSRRAPGFQNSGLWADGTRSMRRTTNTFRLVNAMPDLDTAESAERNEFKIIRLQAPRDFKEISHPIRREPDR